MTDNVKLNDLFSIKKGKKVKATRIKSQNSVPYLLIDTLRGQEPEFFTEDKDYTEAEEKDILIVFDGANSGLVGTGLRGAVGSTIARLKPKKEVSTKYINYFLYLNFSSLNQDVKGSAIPHIKPKKLLELTIRYPSIEEQELTVQEIEKQLTRLDESVKTIKAAKQKIEIYRKSVLKKAFRKKESWEEKKLNATCVKINDGTHFTPKYTPTGIKFISVKDIRDNKIDFSGCKYISEEEHDILHKRCDPERGDVLITKSGTIGRTALVETDEKFDLFVSVALLKPKRDVLDSKFLMYFLDWYIKNTNIDQKIKGAVVKNFHVEDIKETKINFPISLKEQQTIVQEIEDKFSVIDKLEKVIDNSLKKAEQMKKSILKAAFEGKLIKGDNND
jgi:type I restriction enzyme S subunit